ncbi:MAG: ABC transporter permease [Candidatus Aminicenantes bacterium]|nr:ABC transporter permease [Candidatus Aminicenantes bacterium]
MIKNYLKIALRTINKHRGYSFINIAGLAVGITCCVLILLWVQDELSYDRFHENSNNIYRTVLCVQDNWWTSSPWALGPTLKKDFPEIQMYTRYGERQRLIKYEDKSYNESVAFADPEFFDIFTFPFVDGRPEPVFPTVNSVVLTEKTAKKYFGNNDSLGKIINFNNQFELTVTGIIEEVPSNSHMQFDVVIPVLLFGEQINTEWSIESSCYIHLSDNIDIESFREKISGIVMKYDRRTDQTILLDLQPLSRIHLYSLRGGGNIIYIYIFSFIAVIILLIACINFMNLSTARGGTRAKEVGMRKVVGARRSHIIKQFYGESLLLAVIALTIAIGLIFLFLPSFNKMSQKTLSFDLGNNLTMLLGLLFITLFTGIISGSYPALLISSFHPVKVIKGGLRTGSSKSALRKVLVICQFTIAIVLIIGTLVVYKQLHYIRNKDLGFSRDQVLSISINRSTRPSYPALKEEFLKHPSVLQVTTATGRPTQVGNINPVYWEGRGPEQYETWNFVSTDFDYVKTFEMKIVQGRDFSKEYETDRQNYIINEEGAKRTGLDDPIGKLFSIWENEGQIIGVVKDFHMNSLHNEIQPVVITLSDNWAPNILFIKIRPENIQATIKDLEKSWKKFVQDFPFEFQFLDESFEAQYRTDQRTGSLFKTFAFLAIFISCLGIFGLAAFMAERRTKEIGVRKVLGASIPNIMGLISKEFMILLTVANVIAWSAAFFLAKGMLNRYAYRTNIGLWVFLIAGVLSYTIALLTVSYQAFKAARTDPAKALRYE